MQLFDPYGTTLHRLIFSLFLANISFVGIGSRALRLAARDPATVDPEWPPCRSDVLSCSSEVPMAKALDDLPGRMTVEEFLEWLDRWPDDPAFELIEGVPVAMAPGRAIHARYRSGSGSANRGGAVTAGPRNAFNQSRVFRNSACS